jgi:hypothetical protein
MSSSGLVAYALSRSVRDMSTATALESSFITEDDNFEPIPAIAGSQPSAFVIYTSANRTLKALEKASEMVKPAGGRVEVVALQVVPFQLPLNHPPVCFELVIRHFKEMAEQLPVDMTIHAYLCREPWAALKKILSPNAPIVIGVRKRWWPTSEERLARKLRRAGYHVILVETE